MVIGTITDGDDEMTFTLHNGVSGQKLGERTYLSHSAARAVALRCAGKWKKNANLRGNSIKIVADDGSVYGQKVIEWVAA
jgi:hypothetical protein